MCAYVCCVSCSVFRDFETLKSVLTLLQWVVVSCEFFKNIYFKFS